MKPEAAPAKKGAAAGFKPTPLDYVAIALLLALAVTFWLPSRAAATMAANEASAVEFMRALGKAQAAFRAKQGGSPRHALTFSELATAGVYNGPAAEGLSVERNGYLFKLGALDPRAERYYVIATPVRFGASGSQAYYIDDKGVLHSSPAPVVGPSFPEVK